MGEKTLLVDLETEKKKQAEKKLKEIQKQSQRQEKPKQKRISPFSASAFPKEDTEKLLNHQKEIKPITEVQIIDDGEVEDLIEERTEEEIEVQTEKKIEVQIEKRQSTIETPNYDTLETLTDEQRDKIFITKKENPKAEPKPKKNRFKLVMFAIMFALFGIWGIVNVTQIDSVGSQITQVTKEYNLNLVKYTTKLKSLDATSGKNMTNLIETIPEQEEGVTTVVEHSNWFDRFCNFLAGFFGK